MHESTAYDTWVEEGEKRGEARVLLRLGTRRFGPPDAEIENALKSIDDLARLERLADAMFTADSWQQLLATP